MVDEFPPYVETGKAILGADGRFTLYGTVVDEGGISGILERGFVISPKPISTLVDAGITKVLSTVNDNNFSSSLSPLPSPGRNISSGLMRSRQRVISSEPRKLLSLPRFPGPVIGRMLKRALPGQTGGRVHGLDPTMPPTPINGLCIRNWVGYSQARVWIPGSGFGRMD